MMNVPETLDKYGIESFGRMMGELKWRFWGPDLCLGRRVLWTLLKNVYSKQ